jgi:hypothetical protein
MTLIESGKGWVGALKPSDDWRFDPPTSGACPCILRPSHGSLKFSLRMLFANAK